MVRRSALALLALAFAAPLGASATDAGAGLLNPLFQDHAILQRDQPNHVWGDAKAGDKVTVSFAGKQATARADAKGHWEATLPAVGAGGPYQLTASVVGGASQSISDVLVGDVWLCSGQSNMVLQVKRTLDSRSEIQNADNDRIRMLTLDNVSSVTPLDRIPAADHWLKTTPENVPEFSAACYYFARELQKTVDVPMGLVVSAWGGSRIEPWMSAQALRKVGGYDGALDLLEQYARDPQRAGQQWDAQWRAWWHARAGVAANDEPWNPAHVSQAGWQDAPLDKGAWQRWGKPELASFTGTVWYRTIVKLTAAQAKQGATLHLSTVNEADQTWVNGHWVGTEYGGQPRSYAIPAGLLHEGDNLIAINVLNTYRDGGLYGDAAQRNIQLADGSAVSLADHWQYRVVPSSYGHPPSVPWQSTQGLSTIYNGMIAPLGDFVFRGALWYQGESNTGDASAHYQALLEALRADFRQRFGAQLPMLIVQLAGYGAAPTHPSESGTAGIREAQRLAAANDAHSALAVAVDIGERTDIHPANKQELGRRLARAARQVVYGEKNLPPSGPVPVSVQRDGDGASIRFKDVTDALVVYGADHPAGFELCGAQAGSCHYADAQVHGDSVSLHASLPAGDIARVRYCWADSPVCTLYDHSGLPAGPFEMPVSPNRSTQDSHR
ncbi:sialate O-acetylesterase [Dyella sp. C9]|uniref:sialate O-acetylesterase n=1 Tax=Dyella sp. C9 TaxID=2202154 RepID=UPI000DEFEEE7|nr:sialate O-acetylesterase [Dyella sp. C9]